MEANEFYTQKKNIVHPRWKQLKECRCSYEKAKKMGIEFADQQNKELIESIKLSIDNLESKRESWMGQEGEKMRKQFKDGLSWAIESFKCVLSNDNQETQ